jgi:hypothetical protein
MFSEIIAGDDFSASGQYWYCFCILPVLHGPDKTAKKKQEPKMWKRRKTMKTAIYLATGDDIAVSDFKR